MGANSALRSHACGVAKVETRGRVPGVGRIVVVTPRDGGTGEGGEALPADDTRRPTYYDKRVQSKIHSLANRRGGKGVGGQRTTR